MRGPDFSVGETWADLKADYIEGRSDELLDDEGWIENVMLDGKVGQFWQTEDMLAVLQRKDSDAAMRIARALWEELCNLATEQAEYDYLYRNEE